MKNKLFLITLFLTGITATAQDEDLHYQILHGFQRIDSRKEINIPDIMGYKTLKCDFHMHTIFSDGHVTPSERVNEAWREGLDAIAMTDHNTPQRDYIDASYNRAYELAISAAERREVIVIPGTEYSKSKPVGHLNFIFINDADPYADLSLKPRDAVEMAAEEGAFIIYNHPGWPDKNSDLFEFQLDFIEEDKIYAMEVINSKEFYPIVVDYCNKYDLAPLSTTDIHDPIQATYDVDKKHRNLTLVFARNKSMEAIKEALFARRTVAYANDMLVGKEKFLQELIRESLVVSDLKMDDTHFSCNVTNRSDIPFYFDGPSHNRITFPANRTVRLRNTMEATQIVHQVSNTYLSSTRHMELPLNFILTGGNEVDMPYVKQNLTLIEPGTRIEVFCTTPDAEIRYTLDGSKPDESSPLYTSPLVPDHSSMLSLRAFKEGMKPSGVFRKQVLLDKLHEAQKISNLKNGVHYRYYEGVFSTVTNIETKGKFLKEGVIDYPDISIARAEDHFGIIFDGYIYAPKDGLYTFVTESDDGSVFRISGVNLINNDGSHSLTRVSSSIPLKKGYHPYELRYMEDYEGQELNFLWSLPDEEEEPVAGKYLFIKK